MSEKEKLLDNFDISLNRTNVPEFIERIHKKNKCWNLLCFCCYKQSNLDEINNNHIYFYNKLKSLAIQYYDSNNESHELSLRFFYISVINNDLSDNLENSEWCKIGFQNKNPRTDFRAGGYISLLFLIYFEKQFSNEYNEIINIEYFALAITAIKITYIFKIFFNLFDHNIIDYYNLLKINKLKEINISQFINFFDIYSIDQNILYEILARWLIIIKNMFLKNLVIEEREKNINLMEQIINKSFEQIYSSLNYRDPISYLDNILFN